MRHILRFALFLSTLATTAFAQDLPLKDILIPGEDWVLVGEGYKFTEAPAADLEGNVYFSDVPTSTIYKIDSAGKVSQWAKETANVSGLALGPGGVLYGSQSSKQTIAKFDAAGKISIVAEQTPGNDLIVAKDGGVYCTDSGKGTVLYVSPNGEKKTVAEGIAFPNGIILTPDGGTLIVAEMKTDKLVYFRVHKDGTLADKQRYVTLMCPEGKTDSGADGMAVDTVGRVYVATYLGVQVIDTQGRVSGVISKPQAAFLANIDFGGPEMDTLYATSTDKVYKRKLKAKGAR
jgi:sugar lactone lactonase YvrE